MHGVVEEPKEETSIKGVQQKGCCKLFLDLQPFGLLGLDTTLRGLKLN